MGSLKKYAHDERSTCPLRGRGSLGVSESAEEVTLMEYYVAPPTKVELKHWNTALDRSVTT